MGIVTSNKAQFNYHLPSLSGELWIILVNGISVPVAIDDAVGAHLGTGAGEYSFNLGIDQVFVKEAEAQVLVKVAEAVGVQPRVVHQGESGDVAGLGGAYPQNKKLIV